MKADQTFTGFETLYKWFIWMIGTWAVIAMASGGVRVISGGDISGEREGDVKWDDCREKFYHKERPASDLLSVYTCSYERNGAAVIIGGTCARIEYPYFGVGCRAAHIYSRESDVKCAAGAWPDRSGTGCTK